MYLSYWCLKSHLCYCKNDKNRSSIVIALLLLEKILLTHVYKLMAGQMYQPCRLSPSAPPARYSTIVDFYSAKLCNESGKRGRRARARDRDVSPWNARGAQYYRHHERYFVLSAERFFPEKPSWPAIIEFPRVPPVLARVVFRKRYSAREKGALPFSRKTETPSRPDSHDRFCGEVLGDPPNSVFSLKTRSPSLVQTS